MRAAGATSTSAGGRTGPARPWPRLLRIAAQTQLRGHHAFGLAWLDAQGDDPRTFKRQGPATADLGDLDRCRGALVVIGHCRWATNGAPEDNRNNHPHLAGRGWLVHNGVVLNYASLLRRVRFVPQRECDSEVLGLLMARFSGALGLRAARAAELAEGRLAVHGLWVNPARLLIVRNGNPLCFGETAGGYYFSRLPGKLPGRVLSITDQYFGILVYQRGQLRHQTYSIGR